MMLEDDVIIDTLSLMNSCRHPSESHENKNDHLKNDKLLCQRSTQKER